MNSIACACQHACQKFMPSAFKKERVSRNKSKKNTKNMSKKEVFKLKYSTTVVFKIQKPCKIRQDSSFLTKKSTKANMANFKILR